MARVLVMVMVNEGVGHSGRDGMVKRKPSSVLASLGWVGRAGRRLSEARTVV